MLGTRRMAVALIFTAIMSAGYLLNMMTANHPGVAFVLLLSGIIGGCLVIAELTGRKGKRT